MSGLRIDCEPSILTKPGSIVRIPEVFGLEESVDLPRLLVGENNRVKRSMNGKFTECDG